VTPFTVMQLKAHMQFDAGSLAIPDKNDPFRATTFENEMGSPDPLAVRLIYKMQR